MGFYIRKSISVGPFRFNLSKSGVGVSAGIKGLRLGSGPRGNYVHMGRGGLYYRASLPANRPSPPQVVVPTPIPQTNSKTTAPFAEISSASPLQMQDSSSANLLEELNAKNRLSRNWPGVFIFGLIVTCLLGVSNVPGWLPLLALVVAGVAAELTRRKDELAKSVVLLYDLENEAEAAFDRVCTAFASLAQTSKAWHIEASAAVLDRKYEAGAGSVVKRQAITLANGVPPYVKTNINVPTIALNRAKLYFFPDRLLVYGAAGVGAVGYRDLMLDVDSKQFVENQGVPQDSKVVSHTWQYVNKDGGPDRRFKNNPQLPVALYETIHLKSPSGLNELLHVSRVGFGKQFYESLQALAPALR